MTDEQKLSVPGVVSWPIFPFEGDLTVRPLQPRHDVERLRNGDPGGDPCHRCTGELRQDPVWSNDRWAVYALRFDDAPAPFPAYMLETIEHLDIDELDETHGAELGVLTIRLNQAILGLGDVGRVHINRWGDGARHFHVWFMGRPLGAWQFSGFTLPLWGFVLPPLDAEVHAQNDRALHSALNEYPPL